MHMYTYIHLYVYIDNRNSRAFTEQLSGWLCLFSRPATAKAKKGVKLGASKHLLPVFLEQGQEIQPDSTK